jgi:hypothetical protein
MASEVLDTGRDLVVKGGPQVRLTVPRLPAHGVAPVRRLEPRLLRTIIGNAPSRLASVAVTPCSERYAA